VSHTSTSSGGFSPLTPTSIGAVRFRLGELAPGSSSSGYDVRLWPTHPEPVTLDLEGITLEIRILGPLEVFEGTRRVEIASRKQRMLLTVLALAPGLAVSADHLMGEYGAISFQQPG
jgi:hypothetical protein